MFFSEDERFTNKNMVLYNGEIICKGGKKDRDHLGPACYHNGPAADKMYVTLIKLVKFVIFMVLIFRLSFC